MGGKKVSKEIKADVTLDVRGRVCPYPLLMTKKKIDSLNPGQVLEVLVTDPTAPDNIAAWAEDQGHQLVSVVEEEEYSRVYVRKKG